MLLRARRRWRPARSQPSSVTARRQPSGDFNANAAWLQLAALCHNLTRALGRLASPRHTKARAATIRNELINIAARAARGYLTWHLPHNWPWQHHWQAMFDATHRPKVALAA